MYQRLCHVSFSIELKYLWRVISFKHEENLMINIVKWQHKSEDELTWLISCMHQNVATSYVSENQEWIVSYFTNITLKFSTLMTIIKKICVDKKNCLLIFITFLISQYTVKCFFQNLDFEVTTLCVDMFTQKRFTVTLLFNDVNFTLQVLVIIYWTCSLRLNLHKCCSTVVMLELMINNSTVLQVIDYVHCLDQKTEQWI